MLLLCFVYLKFNIHTYFVRYDAIIYIVVLQSNYNVNIYIYIYIYINGIKKLILIISLMLIKNSIANESIEFN